MRIDKAVSSPLTRAYHTAQFALGETRAPMLTTEMGFMEIAHGTWEGLLASEIAERDPDLLRAWREAPDSVLMPAPVRKLRRTFRPEPLGATMMTSTFFGGMTPVSLL